jgi:diacylglycerol kinase (ATP)
MAKTESDRQGEKFSIQRRLKSFRPAIMGLGALIRNEHNARIHLAVLVLVIAGGCLAGISPAEWLAVIILAGLVFAAECFNSAIEYLSDLITGEENEQIRKAKDIAAAGVLVSALAAVIAGIIIFIPRIIMLWH